MHSVLLDRKGPIQWQEHRGWSFKVCEISSRQTEAGIRPVFDVQRSGETSCTNLNMG